MDIAAQLTIPILLLLWFVLVGILGFRTFGYFRKKKWPEFIVFAAILITLLILTGGYAIFFTFLIGCSVGLDLPCIK